MNAAMKVRKLLAPAPSIFAALVEEAITMHRDASPRFGDNRDNKLSASAYLRDALRNGKTTVEKLRKLRALLDQEPDAHPWINTLLDAVYRGATATDGSANLHPVVANLHMLIRADITPVLVEAMQFGTTALELVALAVLRATEEKPETFGAIEDQAAHDDQLRQRQARLTALYAEIPGAAMAEQQITLHHQGGDLWRLTYRWRGEDTGVGYSPDAASGAALVEDLLSTP